ncbi:MAG TPA: TIGR03435 family protein [Bryobacteraceae bacterium]|nr:TIGR03435 family protein [Bryobacteraceae bacterium]
MNRIASLFPMVLVAAGGVWGQSGGARPVFEVASIRLSSPEAHQGNSGIESSPGRIIVQNTRLVQCLAWAYGTPGKISGPDWIFERYDIVAKAGEAVPEAVLKLMLQSLLEERLKLKLRLETIDTRAIVLVVGKGGPKNLRAKESGGSDGNPGGRQYSSPGKLPDGEYEFENWGVQLKGVSLRSLAVWLGNRPPNGVGETVKDETGINGAFDFALSVKDFETTDGSSDARPYDDLKAAAFGYWSRTLEQQYGLKLEYRKVQVEGLVVENGNKIPTEN